MTIANAIAIATAMTAIIAIGHTYVGIVDISAAASVLRVDINVVSNSEVVMLNCVGKGSKILLSPGSVVDLTTVDVISTVVIGNEDSKMLLSPGLEVTVVDLTTVDVISTVVIGNEDSKMLLSPGLEVTVVDLTTVDVISTVVIGNEDSKMLLSPGLEVTVVDLTTVDVISFSSGLDNTEIPFTVLVMYSSVIFPTKELESLSAVSARDKNVLWMDGF